MSNETDPTLQLPPIGAPDITVLVNGVPTETYVVLLPSPGGARMFGSDDVAPGHIAHTFRSIAAIIERDTPPCGCGEGLEGGEVG